ncbi:MAG: hypothetical protein ACO26G_06240 [Rickettsiales bacterium]
MKHSKTSNKLSQTKNLSKVSLGERIKNFLRLSIYYLGILFTICVAIYALYMAVPEILKMIRSFIVDLITKDYAKNQDIINPEAPSSIENKNPE